MKGYQKIINLLGNSQNPPYKFKAKNWTEINRVEPVPPKVQLN